MSSILITLFKLIPEPLPRLDLDFWCMWLMYKDVRIMMMMI